MADQKAYLAYRQAIKENADKQSDVRDNLKKLEEQGRGVEIFQADMGKLLQDIGYSWSLGGNEVSPNQAAAFRELNEFEVNLAVVSRQTYTAIADKRESLKSVLRKLEDKEENLSCEYKNKLTNP